MRLIGAAAAALLLLVAAAPAAAHHRGTSDSPWVGLYNVDLSGRQSTSWTFDHEPSEPCDRQEQGSGTEADAFSSSGGAQVLVSGVGARPLDIAAELSSIRLHVHIERNGSIALGPEPSGSECPSPAAEAEPASDCGAREGTMNVALGAGGGTALTVGEAPEPEFATTPIDPEHEAEAPYSSCPSFGAVLPEGLLETTLRVASAGAPSRGSSVELGPPELEGSGSTGASLSESPEVSGSTSTAFTLRLRRIAAPAEVSAGAGFVLVAPDGSASIELRCPRGVDRCRGSTYLVADTSQGAQALSRFPAPPLAEPSFLGETRFSLKGGESRRVPVRIGRATPAFLRSLRRLNLYAGVRIGAGGHSIRYLVAAARFS